MTFKSYMTLIEWLEEKGLEVCTLSEGEWYWFPVDRKILEEVYVEDHNHYLVRDGKITL